MKTTAINFKEPFIAGLHAIVMEGMKCCLCDIIGPKDTREKFLTVFILVQFYGYRQRDIAQAYTLNFHYVPTVVESFQEHYAKSERMREIVQQILNKLDYYEEVAGM